MRQLHNGSLIIKKISTCALLSTLLMIVKYVFGFLPGVEIFTFLIIIYALLLPLSWSLLIGSSVISMIGIVYGFGTWWIMYWFIFPIEIILTFLLKKIVGSNNIIFAIWTGFWGFSILFWYAIYDYIVFGKSYMLSSMATSVIPNLIGAVSNFFVALLGFYPIKKIFENNIANIIKNNNY